MNSKPIKQETLEIIKIVGLALLISAVMAGFMMVKGRLDQLISIEYSNCINNMHDLGDVCTLNL